MALAPDIVEAVARRLAVHAGLELPAWVVEARASARMQRLGVTAPAYVELIGAARGAAELDELLECVRVGETRLFRHRQQIDALAQVLAPRLREHHDVRVWSAGCAAGEEAYTLAAILRRAVPHGALSILATDMSEHALEVARAGRYPAAAIAHVPEAYRDDFVVEGGELVVRPELGRLVRFERANLIEPPPESGFELVWVRNVLIYFTDEARKQALAHVVAATRLGGFVFVGYSESLRDVAELEPMRAGDAVYYVRVGKRAAPRTPPVGVAHAVAAPPVWREPTQPRIIAFEVYRVTGAPDPARLTSELSQRLAVSHLRLVVDLDGAELLADELAPVFRRAIAAAHAANVELELRATKPGTRRWLARHRLELAA